MAEKRPTYAAAILLVFVLLLATGIWIEWGGGPQVATRGASAAAQPVLNGGVVPASLPDQRYARVSQAFRAHDLDAAGAALGGLAGDGLAPADARLLLGLAAYSTGQRPEAGELLAGADDREALLGDWRLHALADLAADAGDTQAALDHLATLIDAYPASPLRPGAVVAAARLHAANGEEWAALDLVHLARREELSGGARVDLEELAWKLGRKLNDDSVRRDAARRLLIHSPWKAASLGVPRMFHDGNGRVDWSRVLTGPELEQRARSFLELDQAGAALATLESVPRAGRGVDWHLVRADALTRLHRGDEALAVLDGARPASRAEQAAIAWQRALATADLATARSGGLPSDDRARLRRASLAHLRTVARLGADAELAARALRRLYEEIDEDDFEARQQVLRELRRFDPNDRTGAGPLWERGWNEYRAGNHTAAVAYWTELDELYPEDREAHRSRYWKGRALEALGETRRARQIYEHLVSSTDTTDFYRKQAMVRLGTAPRLATWTAEVIQEPRSWDIDPLLRRAKMLVDLGLDELAEREIAAVEAGAEKPSSRDVLALEALMLARQGKQRTGIVMLRRAFPELGGAKQASIPTEILRAYYPVKWNDVIRTNAEATGLPPHLVAGIIRQESAFDPRATSPVGARGLMQVMPATAREVSLSLGEAYSPTRLYDPSFSIRLGTTYLSRVLRMFDGNVELALAGYNGGPNRIRRLWREEGPDPELDDFLETLRIDESRNYVKRILVLADSYRQLYPEELARPTS
ncbi:MAG TPA: transglycosylase SLT domain-containing protein [Thermoanaerobaculia bacterium]|nr:transglycosylase SLT domain-containing protein [Thermoanaerobaculia bacterium]